ncbi:MAG: hypothetical protein DDT22_01005 [candidate division WS2 bacterium]|nr:hypothetical protein [Candidatus Lithacetigena glycinireducens]
MQTQDGGYILAGGTNSFGAGGYDVYVIKLNSQGNKIWEKVYGGTKTDYASAILQTQDGRYVLAGATNSFGAYGYNIYILKLTNDGGLQYQKTYGGNVDDYASSIVQTQDGGYILAGGTSSFGSGGYDVYVAKIDSSCELKWQKTLGGSAADRGYSIAQTSDGRYIIAGETFSFGAGENDMYVIKMNAEANAGPKPAAKARIDKTFFSPLPYQKFILPFYFK